MSSIIARYSFVLIPSLLVILFFSIAFTPVEVFGCSTRGLLAFSVSMICGITALVISFIEIYRRRKGIPQDIRQVISVLILLLPLLYIYYTEM